MVAALNPPKASLCYLLRSVASGRTYIGCTNDIQRRLRQHNGLLSGGARATSAGGPWEVAAFVRGFEDRREALRFEWSWKRRVCRRAATRGLIERLLRASELTEGTGLSVERLTQ